jgi:hypothetical protein
VFTGWIFYENKDSNPVVQPGSLRGCHNWMNTRAARLPRF